MTEQQEFLDYLKDPTKAQLKAAVRYYQTFNSDIRIAFVEEDNEKYIIDIMADTFTAMAGSTEDFAMMLEKFIDKSAICTRLRSSTCHSCPYRGRVFISKRSLPW